VSVTRAWLDGRRPPPPPDLDAELSRDFDRVPRDVGARSGETPGGDVFHEVLLRAARARLDESRARPGRVRESAFELLAADALITYACEAALESDDPEAALGRLFEVGEVR
jgi:hypothetical protein